MRIHLGVVLLGFLCLWIPVAQAHERPEDPDTSGDYDDDDDDDSGSGSGFGESNPTDDFDFTPEVIPNTTITTRAPNVPVGLPEHHVTQSSSTIPPKADPKTPELINLAPMLSTTQLFETTVSPTTVQSTIPVDLEEEPEDAQTTGVPYSAAQTTGVPYSATQTTGVPYSATQTAGVPSSADEIPVLAPTAELTTTSLGENFEERTTAGILYEDETMAYDYATDEPETTELPLGSRASTAVADPEASGDDVSMTTQAVVEDMEENIIPDSHPETNLQKEVINDDDFVLQNEIGPKGRSSATVADNENLLERKEVLAGVIAGGVVGLAFAVMLVALMVYRMKKKDEGSYSLDEHKHPNGGYQKPQRQEEFLA